MAVTLRLSPALSISFNQGNNIINTPGFTNDGVGNITNDSFHAYSYDADGNLISVDNGQTARYYYDSLNQRVQIAPTRGTYEFVWDTFGRRVSTWAASNHGFAESNAYTDSAPIAIRAGGQTQFEHQNWLGTERVRTSYNGAVLLSLNSLPWADGHTPSGDNGDQHDFAQMERDLEDNTEHAQFRQYSTNLGRWQSPDFYLGSYDFANPQSFNRYTYASNNPVVFNDPLGLYGAGGGHPCDDPSSSCFAPGDPCISCVSGGGGGAGQSTKPGKPFVFKVTAYLIWLHSFDLQVAILTSVPFGPAGGLGAAPSNVNPSKSQIYAQCVTQTLTPALKNDFARWTGQIRTAVKFGVAAGVGVAAVITFSEPELLPAAPAIALISAASTSITGSMLATQVQSATAVGQAAGAAYYCAQNTFGGG